MLCSKLHYQKDFFLCKISQLPAAASPGRGGTSAATSLLVLYQEVDETGQFCTRGGTGPGRSCTGVACD